MAAEPRQGDTGGEIFVQALKQVHIGLMVYVLLMVGVLGARGSEFGLPLVPLLFVVMWSLHGLDGYLWANLPLDRVFDLDDADPAFEEGLDHQVYEQAECRVPEQSPAPPQIVVSRRGQSDGFLVQQRPCSDAEWFPSSKFAGRR
ncbi:unnamed protein product [Symbiodinium pilosum]|uniref:Uncharacterized protein n=1 Tax=Symbiodinium pilosum TaxID=2952 RepID=A0A812V9G2_SYMPI|nr:unnamed protein product [Symbiodinium pilosum]